MRTRDHASSCAASATTSPTSSSRPKATAWTFPLSARRAREQRRHEVLHARLGRADPLDRPRDVRLGRRVHGEQLGLGSDQAERRAQLVRCLRREASLGFERALEPVEHVVERVRELLHLVVGPLEGDALRRGRPLTQREHARRCSRAGRRTPPGDDPADQAGGERRHTDRRARCRCASARSRHAGHAVAQSRKTSFSVRPPERIGASVLDLRQRLGVLAEVRLDLLARHTDLAEELLLELLVVAVGSRSRWRASLTTRTMNARDRGDDMARATAIRVRIFTRPPPPGGSPRPATSR